ncbi:MAG: ISKra4 family transposase [candidate division Zixibacteria bacterium]|nr:ISKra4 family transposase [candidate division Zixibacteria bacterium]
MPAKLIEQNSNKITIQFTVELTGQMLTDEQALQESLNEAGQAAMAPMLKQFDTNGEPIRINGVKHTVKSYAPQDYETPYGPVQLERYTYQTSKGGRAYVPLENDARMILNSTPRYSQMVSGKYARLGADAICEDLLECNGRKLSRNYAKKLSDFVGTVAQCHEVDWEYDLPEFDTPVASVGIGLDGTCMLMHNDGWREAMNGSIAFYDHQGERLHTIYCAATPEYGKEKFKEKFAREIERVKGIFPEALYVGVADGAKDNWTFLKQYTQRRILDFYHAREYISKAGTAIFGRDKKSRDLWINDWSHRLKHKQGTVGRLLKELELQRANLDKKNFIERDEEIRKAIVYFTNNKGRMSYTTHLKLNLPIGSGVTEAACKTVVKQRMCISGSRWKDDGASCVLALRTLKLTKGRWQQFWSYIMRHGATSY